MSDQILAQPSPLPIHEEQGVLWVDARTLHTALQVGSDFSNWIKRRLEEVDAVENEDFIVLDSSPNLASKWGGTNRRDYWLSLDIAKEIAMLERNEIGKAIRRYFIETEKAYKARQQSMALPSYPEALRQLAAKIELTEQQAQQLALAAPKVEAFDALMDSTSSYLVREAAKVLGLGQNRLYDLMRAWGLIIPGSCEPYQQHVDAGRFVVKVKTFMRGTEPASGKTTYITTKGLDYLRRRLSESGVLA